MDRRLLIVLASLAAASPVLAEPTTRPMTPSELVAAAKADLAAARADAEAAGIATTLESFAAKIESVPPERNAAIEFMAAAKVMDAIESMAWQAWEEREGEPTAADWDHARQAMRDFEPVLAALAGADAKLPPAVEAARGDFGINWQEADENLLMNISFSELSGQMGLSALLGAQAQLAAHDGTGSDVALPLRRLLGQARVVEDGHLSLVGHLVAIGFESRAANVVQDAAATLAVGDADDEMSPQDARLLVELLLKNDDAGRFRQAMSMEILFQQNAIDYLHKHGSFDFTYSGAAGEITAGDRLQAMFMRPYLWRNAETMLRLSRSMIDDANHAAIGQARADVDEHAAEVDAVQQNPTLLYAAVLMPSLDRRLVTNYRGRAHKALAAVGLATAIYRADHADALPPTLEALVPDYLPAVPVDPLGDGQPLQYDADRGIVWSVGDNGVDDGGTPDDHPLLEDADLVVRLRP